MSPVRSQRVAIGWLTALGAAVVALMVATVVRGDNAPIPQLGGVLVAGAIGWGTAVRLRSRTPITKDWFQYVRTFVVTPPVIAGALVLAVTGGRDGTLGLRVIGGLVAVVALVFLVSEVRDFRLWRAEVRRSR